MCIDVIELSVNDQFTDVAVYLIIVVVVRNLLHQGVWAVLLML